ncbi:hypothetical protein JIN84_09520 [Luteolibacter yonseiensis]|uniref:Uncharacterized protein n=1 Tax=Luteolibacter yonseiensis TaxID=1144680 RepID=A0A934VBE7_9BACT|nr:hypothetical protein [Luteolibacter yonseiensis]MBK1815856.1 hypothetical protein [Luteolibacter yonseiensis]
MKKIHPQDAKAAKDMEISKMAVSDFSQSWRSWRLGGEKNSDDPEIFKPSAALPGSKLKFPCPELLLNMP